MIDYDCPCGGMAVYKGNPPGGRVECCICKYSGPHRVDPDEARADWNSQVAEWTRRNKGTDDPFTAISLLRPEMEGAALKGLAIWDATLDLEKTFSAVRLHLELVVQELNEWKLLDRLVDGAQQRVQVEIESREISRRAEVEMFSLAERGEDAYSTRGREPGFSIERSLKNNVIPPPWFPQATTPLPLAERPATRRQQSTEPPPVVVPEQPLRVGPATKRPSRVIRRRGKDSYIKP